MPFTLASITRGGQPQPPRMVVYGPHGVGKTTFGASAPDAIVLRTEDGLATIDVPTFPLATEYEHVLAALRTLAFEAHPFRALVLDSLDWLEPLIWAAVARDQGKDNIEDIGYGKGYVMADEKWTDVLELCDRLRARGMVVILVAHSEVKRFDSPDTEPYDRHQIKLHKRAAALAREWADVIGFAHQEVFTQATDMGFNKKLVRGVGSGRRLLSVDERPAFDAKNRYRLPADLPLDYAAVIGAISEAYAPALGAPALAAPMASPQATEDEPAPLDPDQTDAFGNADANGDASESAEDGAEYADTLTT